MGATESFRGVLLEALVRATSAFEAYFLKL